MIIDFITKLRERSGSKPEVCSPPQSPRQFINDLNDDEYYALYPENADMEDPSRPDDDFDAVDDDELDDREAMHRR
jgi:hypothetical protein